MMDITSAPGDFFQSNSISYRSSGSWLRIVATWRGGNDYNVAIHKQSGVWKDHVTGDCGNFEKLCSLLNINGDGFKPDTISAERKKTEYSVRVDKAKKFWGRSTPMQLGDTSYQYLVSRGGEDGIQLAETALNRTIIRTGISKLKKYEKASPCLIAPIVDPSNSELCGVQRVWKRGHSGKKMWGVHIPKIAGSEARHSGGMIISGEGDILYIVEGLETGLAVALSTGQKVFVLYDTSGLESVPVLNLDKLGVKRVVIAGDHDEIDTNKTSRTYGKCPGHAAATICAHRLIRQGIKDVKISIPELLLGLEKTDWLDVLAASNKEEVAQQIITQEVDPEKTEETTTGATIQALKWFERMPEGFVPIQTDFETLDSARVKLDQTIKEALESDDLTIIASTSGTGKTAASAIKVITSNRPVLFLTRTLDDAKEVAEKIPGGHLHIGRNKKNCLKFESLVGPIQDKSRAPYAWACQTCEYGPKDAPIPCDYMVNLRSSVYARVVVGVHAAGAEESILYNYTQGAGSFDEETVKRKLVIDETVSENSIHRISFEDVKTWQQTLSSKILTISKEDKKGLVWAERMTTELDRVVHILADAQKDDTLKTIDLEIFRKLGTRIPESVKVADATIAEAVKIPSRPGEEMIVPLKGIQPLAEAMTRRTAFLHQGKIVAVTPGSLWKKAQKMGALMLDATPHISARKTAKIVHEIRVKERGQIVQIGPVQHGRGQLASPIRLARETKDLASLLGKDGVGIGPKPLASSIKKTFPVMEERIGHWGLDEKSHNRWKNAPKLVIYGVEIPNPSDMIILYQAYRAQMRDLEIIVQDWTGETSINQVIDMPDGSRITFPGHLPIVEDARIWLIDRVSAQVAQAEGRLRLCQRTDESALVEIHTPFPVMGHGIRIDTRLIGKSRISKKIKDIKTVAEILDITEHATANEIIAGAASKGHHISDRAARQAARELKAESVNTNKSLHEVAMDAVEEATHIIGFVLMTEALEIPAKLLRPGTRTILTAISESERSAVRAHAGP